MTERRRDLALDLACAAAVTVLVLGPLLAGRGFWLVGDMVFVPQQPWKAAWLGLDGALPRAVPMDALISLATQVVPGDFVQKALLVGGFLAGGLGVARLVAHQASFARAAAITLFCWNPWVYERLLIGQWAILLGYFLLPWVALAAVRLRRGGPGDWAPAAAALVLSAICSPSSGVMAAGVLLVLGLGRDRRGWWRATAIAVVANLTWAIPALTADAARVTTDGVFAAFAARAESGAGVVASVLSLGGIWKTSILPGERTSALLVLLACLLSLAALAGLWRMGADRSRWLLIAGLSLALALAPAIPGGADLLESVGARLPGLALLRDSHRYLAPFGLALAVGIAYAVTAVRARIRSGTQALWSAVALLVVAPLLLLPSLAWGAAGELERSSYPQAWTDVAALIDADETTVVLPWAGSYRGFDWSHRRAVLDPAPRLLPGLVLVDDTVRLEGRDVPAEDPRVGAVAEALEQDDPAAALRDLGVRWVLVEQGMGEVTAPMGKSVYDASGLELIDLSDPGPAAERSRAAWPEMTTTREILVAIGHLLAFLLLLVGVAVILQPGSNGRHTT
ncbi:MULTISPECIES: hypothetical protein [unclassified Nocardioides]|uniref:hypothetical protein n=1 Tax=unclassified Nocardioides TaxID=2615069 RepID=UPI0006F41206|nr:MULTISPECIES: hypothetical protein [unclassified Nocardioides]KRA37318.1 hypothetical protein ASD81_00830 [Nocardioides sp. Root614]KRA91279.1 hypothetical protein ASD84_01095 [Nocardioides sp. Root682]